MIALVCVTIIVLLSGCSLPVSHLNGGTYALGIEERPGNLYRIRIEHNEKLRFHGLAVVKLKENGLDFVLLDPSGITLLEVQIDSIAGEITSNAKGILKNSSLKDILSASFTRTFLLQPAELPCGRNGLMKFCARSVSSNDVLKEAHLGPFLYWRVTGTSQIAGEGSGTRVDTEKEERVDGSKKLNLLYRYSQPWLGLVIHLTAHQ